MQPVTIRLRLVLALSLFCASFSSAAASQTQTSPKLPSHHTSASLEGNWAGSLQAGEAVLHLVLHVSKAADGSLKATLDSLDQGVYGIEVTSLTQKASTLQFSVSSVGVSYEGKISVNYAAIDGVWSQGRVGLSLVFHRQAAGAGAKKPSDAISGAEGVWQGA
ncbi:MAG: hypothetical protein ACM37Z_03530, partial [Deltaproteobacteria bacterium]